jgi:hypothetical protein
LRRRSSRASRGFFAAANLIASSALHLHNDVAVAKNGGLSSINQVLMPTLNAKLAVLLGKLLRSRKLSGAPSPGHLNSNVSMLRHDQQAAPLNVQVAAPTFNLIRIINR